MVRKPSVATERKRRYPPMQKTVIAALALMAAVGAGSAFASSSSCVQCHTNVDTMKAMVPKPAEPSGEAGEG